MGLTAGRGPHSPPTTSPNQCGVCVLAVLSCVGTTTSALSKPPVSLGEYPEEKSRHAPISSAAASDMWWASTG